MISIHAPREGCDQAGVLAVHLKLHFNPRTPRGVRPLVPLFPGLLGLISIHAPREGCDHPQAPFHPAGGDFNPRTPRGVRPGRCSWNQSTRTISIHAPREGCDAGGSGEVVPRTLFQSTHPARGATRHYRWVYSRWSDFNPRTPRGVRRSYLLCIKALITISIHAPREGCDATRWQTGARKSLFQSTHPARGATT